MYTLDSNIIIYFLEDDSKVVSFIRQAIYEQRRFFISTITEAELFSYPCPTAQEAEAIEEVLTTISIIGVDSQIARTAALFRKKYKTPLPDALIAATAYVTNSILLSRNKKDLASIKEIKKKFI